MVGTAHATDVDGVLVAWSEMGTGEPLVLVHGLLDSHRTWRRVAPILAEHFRVLLPDLPGCGFSGRPDVSYSLIWYAQLLANWMRTIGLDRANICAHSFGGGIAQWMLLEQHAQIARLALVAPGGLGREIGLSMRLATLPVLGRALSAFVVRFAIPAALPFVASAIGHMEPKEFDCFRRMLRFPGTARAFQRALDGVVDWRGQHTQTFSRIHEAPKLPVIALFWGEDDPIIPARHGADALARTAGITLTTYERAGHYPHLEAPGRFARDVIEFFDDPRRSAATVLPQGAAVM